MTRPNLTNALHKALSGTITRSSRLVLNEAIIAAPHKSGDFRGSLRREETVRGGRYEIGIKSVGTHPAELPIFIRNGTQPHSIFNRNAKALHFELHGQMVFSRSVKHPGTKPNPWAVIALDRSKRVVSAILSEELSRAMEM